MRWRVSALISGLPLSARDTVATDTPAKRAISAICRRDASPARGFFGLARGELVRVMAGLSPRAGTALRPGHSTEPRAAVALDQGRVGRVGATQAHVRR